MQTVIPFRAWRYDPHKAGDLNRLVAPPYDVVDAALQSRLYARSPHNIVRIDLGMTTPSDTECDDRYTRAAVQLADWRTEGILVRDTDPTMTFVEERFTGPDGRIRIRHGFLALLKLYDFGEGVVFPHERTLSGPKEDRFRLMQATGMSLSPVFMLYDLPGDEITKAWQAGPGATEPSHVVVDPDAGVGATETRLWPVSDPALLELAQQVLAGSRFVIADGHHRYETALRYRQYRQEGPAASSACDYVLVYLSNMADPALAIYATHRLVEGVDPGVVASLPQILSPTFEVERLTGEGAAGAAAARVAITEYLEAHPRGAFGFWGPALDGAYGIRLANLDAARKAEPEASPAYQELDVTILQSLVLQKALGITQKDMASETNVTFFKDPDDAFERLAAGEFQVGFFMNPTGLDQIQEVALGGERMPQKATFFYPKLPTGLVFHDLSGEL
jgi:uncharacterized protein (DUF1015 family)